MIPGIAKLRRLRPGTIVGVPAGYLVKLLEDLAAARAELARRSADA